MGRKPESPLGKIGYIREVPMPGCLAALRHRAPFVLPHMAGLFKALGAPDDSEVERHFLPRGVALGRNLRAVYSTLRQFESRFEEVCECDPDIIWRQVFEPTLNILDDVKRGGLHPQVFLAVVSVFKMLFSDLPVWAFSFHPNYSRLMQHPDVFNSAY